MQRFCLHALIVTALIAIGTTFETASQEPHWQLIRELRVGSLDDKRTALSRVSAVAVSPDLSLYVAQPQESTIRLFDAAGQPLRTIGRAGEGPGEFRQLGGIELRGDTLLAVDLRLGRTSRFLIDGRHQATEPFPAPELGEAFRPAPPIGHLVDGSMVYQPRIGPDRQTADPNLLVPVVHLDRSGDVIGRFPSTSTYGDTRLVRTPRGAAVVFSPLSHQDLLRVAPDGSGVIYVRRPPPTRTQQATFSVVMLRSPRDTVFSRSYPYRPQPVPASALDSLTQGVVAFLERGGMSRTEATRFARDPGFIPRHQPPVSGLAVGAGGAIWIGREALGTPTVTWVLLGPTGGPQGSVQLPVYNRLVAAHGDRIWVHETGEWGEEYIVRYRVAR